MAPVQDQNTTTMTAVTTATTTQIGFGSSHPGAMPTLYADGSVRNFSYTASGNGGGASLTTGVVWALLWSFNDGLSISGVD